MTMATFGELRRLLADNNATWQALPLSDRTRIKKHPLGVPSAERLVLDAKAPAVDLQAVLGTYTTTNPFLNQRRAEHKLPILEQQRPAHGPGAATRGSANVSPAKSSGAATKAATKTDAAAAGLTLSAVVDWRNRFGTNWVTQVKDQDPCESCVAFGTTAVIESMVRIHHAVWCLRSEGDTHDGLGLKCSDGSWPDTYFDWVKTHGICDPDCYPYQTNNPPYQPCADRGGRTVKIDDYQNVPNFWLLGGITFQKLWIDTVGPITGCMEVWTDFDGYSSGVYHWLNSPKVTFRGLHCITIVGYSDVESCWIVKNSWGSGWGDHGYVKIGYGEVKIDYYAKYGLAHVNPDPWTKRRLHNGNLYESGNGPLHRNFEMLATSGGAHVRHWWRDNSVNGFPWQQASTFAADAAVCPTLTGTTYNRNFEAVYLTTASRLHHWWLDQNNGQWNDGGVFGPTDAAGVPGFIQGNYGSPGNFEVVVKTADSKLNHWWRDGTFAWHDGGRFASGVLFSGASLIQSNYGTPGNFELVCVLNNGQMQHWWRDNSHGMVWNQGPVFGAGISSPPCMIQGQFGMGTEAGIGNFELCVAAGGQAQHWWRDNQGGMSWFHSATFGHDVLAVAGMIESSYGFNLEVVVLRYDRQLQHYWRDGAGWHEGPVIGPA